MRLLALGDLHLGHKANREALETIGRHPEDWLILAGDVGETADHLRRAFDVLVPRFARLVWVPGNHELWSVPSDDPPLRGEEKYRYLVELCRGYGVLTPEDPYPVWEGDGGRHRIAPLHLLYDYSFRPDRVAAGEALDWARESGVVCADETYLHPDPYPTREGWCEARVTETEARLAREHAGLPTIAINHYPLRRALAVLPRIPRFSIWCGTRRTEDWPERFGIVATVYGHLHIRTTTWDGDVRHEEVSLGYPRQWDGARPVEAYLRTVLPAPPPPAGIGAGDRAGLVRESRR